MERRKFMIGIGSLAAGGAAATGTGAFTNAQASRSISVNVAGDESSYLGLIPSEAPFVSTDSSGSLSINLASSSGNGGLGVPNHGITTIRPAFTVKNQGSETLHIEIDNPLADSNITNGGVDVQFLAVNDADSGLEDDNVAALFDRDSAVFGLDGDSTNSAFADPSLIRKTEGSDTLVGFRGSTSGSERYKGPDTDGDTINYGGVYLSLDPGQEVDVIFRVCAMVDEPSSVNLSDSVTIEAYTDEEATTLPAGENWLGETES